VTHLTSGWLRLRHGTFCCLLAYNTTSGLAGSSFSSTLGLIRLLRTLSCRLLLLALFDSLRPCSRTGLRAHSPALLDHVERSTNDSTLRLDLTTAAGFGLLLSDTLSPLSPAQYSPGNATGILALEKERLGFPILEAEDLAVTADEELALLS